MHVAYNVSSQTNTLLSLLHAFSLLLLLPPLLGASNQLNHGRMQHIYHLKLYYLHPKEAQSSCPHFHYPSPTIIHQSLHLIYNQHLHALLLQSVSSKELLLSMAIALPFSTMTPLVHGPKPIPDASN